MTDDKRRGLSRGEMISTLCFVGVAGWLASEAMVTGGPRALLLWLCAVASLAGALRHQIGRILGATRGNGRGR